MTETHAQFRARLKRERKIKNEAARASLASYYAQSASQSIMDDYANGRYVNISVDANGHRTVTNGPGL